MSARPGLPAPDVLGRSMRLSELVDLPSFTELCASYVELYRVGLKVFDEEGTRLVDVKTGSTDFCAYMFTRLPGQTLCTETVTHLKVHPLPPASAREAIRTRDCFTGARYVMAPIVHEGDAIGRVVLGPFVPEDLPDLAPGLAGLAQVFDLVRARELMSKIRRTSEATVRKVAEHFSKVLEVLLFSSYRSALTSRLHVESISESYRELTEKSRQLKESYERLKELDRLKSTFLATVSHELRTPLTSIIGYSEMLLAGLAGEVSAEQKEYLGTVLEKSEGLLNLITSLLDLSRIEARGIRLTLAPTDVAKVVKESISTVLPQARKKGQELEVQLDEAIPPALCDADKLRQAVVNLLSNAVKFTPERGRIAVRAGLSQTAPEGSGPFGRASRFEVAVEDHGLGIAPEEQEKIFDSFYQVDGSSRREHGGAGLGLAIVKSYAQAHGGTVTVHSRLGQGATFTLVLPLEAPQPARP